MCRSSKKNEKKKIIRRCALGLAKIVQNNTPKRSITVLMQGILWSRRRWYIYKKVSQVQLQDGPSLVYSIIEKIRQKCSP